MKKQVGISAGAVLFSNFATEPTNFSHQLFYCESMILLSLMTDVRGR
ncbi:hypothetical protein AB2S62_20965 [Vibrio sp. NTOU-M3]